MVMRGRNHVLRLIREIRAPQIFPERLKNCGAPLKATRIYESFVATVPGLQAIWNTETQQVGTKLPSPGVKLHSLGP